MVCCRCVLIDSLSFILIGLELHFSEVSLCIYIHVESKLSSGSSSYSREKTSISVVACVLAVG
jgi:hypothetical protein